MRGLGIHKNIPVSVTKLGIHKNIPVSVTKLTLGLLLLGFIKSHLTADKLFPVNQRVITGPMKMSLILKVKTTSALIIKPRLVLVEHTNDIGWNKTSNQQGQMLDENLNGIVRRPNVKPGHILFCIIHCFQLT